MSLEEQSMEATTEEGQKALKEVEEQERAAAAARDAPHMDKYGDPE